MPTLAIKSNPPFSFQLLLGVSNVMLPLLPKMNAVYHTVNSVVAEIGMNALDHWVEFNRVERTFTEKEEDRLGYDCIG